jgi:peptidoglycan-N-acetylglucosamine deacetylase
MDRWAVSLKLDSVTSLFHYDFMKLKAVLIFLLCFLFFFFLSLALLSGQKSRISQGKEQLFQSREELVLIQNRLEEEEERTDLLTKQVGTLREGEPPQIMLTFDDGPSPLTDQILDILASEGVGAVFYINGANVVGTRGDLLERAVAEGHIIGNHTYSHDYNIIYNTVQGFMDDFFRNENLIWQLTNTRSMLVRFPGGSRNSLCRTQEGTKLMKDLKEQMDRRGYIYMDWNVTDNSADSKTLLQSLEDQTIRRDSATVLLHDRVDRAVLLEVLPLYIQDMKKAGYQFVLFDKTEGLVRF